MRKLTLYINMKNLKVFLLITVVSISINSLAQRYEVDEQKGKFKQENVYMGAGVNIGFTNRSYNLGITPDVGYSITKWLDGGMGLNINYYVENTSDYSPYSYHNFNVGGGPYLRIWPLSFLHFQVQPEYNWISSSQRNVLSNQSVSYKYNAGSLLVGVGYGTRVLGERYSYVTLMIDVLQNVNSPYRDQYNDPKPVFRVGFGFYLKPKPR